MEGHSAFGITENWWEDSTGEKKRKIRKGQERINPRSNRYHLTPNGVAHSRDRASRTPMGERLSVGATSILVGRI